MIATTIMSSMRVKPFCAWRVMKHGLLVHAPCRGGIGHAGPDLRHLRCRLSSSRRAGPIIAVAVTKNVTAGVGLGRSLVVAVAVGGLVDAELGQAVAQRAERDAEELGGRFADAA